jgi:nitrite reductase/ring-hydroxylating ferredoxin subunit
LATWSRSTETGGVGDSRADRAVYVCRADDVAPGECRRVVSEPPVAVFNVDGEFYAIEDTCTHDSSSLADGYVDGDVVECSWHFAKFCIRTGAVLGPPAVRSLGTFEVSVSDGCVFVRVSAASEPPARD